MYSFLPNFCDIFLDSNLSFLQILSSEQKLLQQQIGVQKKQFVRVIKVVTWHVNKLLFKLNCLGSVRPPNKQNCISIYFIPLNSLFLNAEHFDIRCTLFFHKKREIYLRLSVLIFQWWPSLKLFLLCSWTYNWGWLTTLLSIFLFLIYLLSKCEKLGSTHIFRLLCLILKIGLFIRDFE